MSKVLIRPLRIEDAKTSFGWRNNPAIWKYTGNKPDIYITEEIETRWLQEKLLDKNSVRFAVLVDDIYVGNIQLTNIIEKQSAEFHIFIGETDFWGKGFAQSASLQLIRYAKSILNIKEIYLFVKPENVFAIRAYEKVGFEKVTDELKMKLDLEKSPSPLVSVFVLTYNHEKYISEAIEGILMQETNFDYDIVIGEDCSSDTTRSIILDYQCKYPSKFKLLLPDKNIGALANQMAVLNACTGKYIAMCEGDDYWTDPYKLQKQIDVLETNSCYSSCACQTLVKFQTKNKSDYFYSALNENSAIDLRSIMSFEKVFQTGSFMFRTENLIKYPDFPSNIASGDRCLFLMNALLGDVFYLKDCMTVYRRHDEGVSNNYSIKVSKKDLNMLSYLMSVNSSFPKYYFKSQIYTGVISYPEKISLLELIRYFILAIFFARKAEFGVEELKKSINRAFAYRVPRNFRRILRKFDIIKNYE